MGVGAGGEIGRGVGHLFAEGTLAGLGDADLLERFAVRRDELAFEVLVARHGPMVLGVCRRVLRDPHAAEDAFQATFLVLARRAASVRRGSSLAGWLYRVAHRISVRERAAVHRRRERELARDAEGVRMTEAPSTEGEMAAILEEIDRLSDRYRTPLVLCGVEGLTAEAAAERMGCPVGTVWGRLSRARERLRTRLLRRGFALGGALGAVAVAVADGAVPQALLRAAVRLGVGAGSSEIAAMASPMVDRMTREGLAMLDRTRRITIATTSLIAGLVLTAGGALAMRGRAQDGPPRPPIPPKVAAGAAEKAMTLPDGCDPIFQRVSPDGLRIAFVGRYTPDEGERQDGLFVFDPATRRVRRLLDTAVNTDPAWSPDSRRIAIGDAPGYAAHYPLVLVDVETGAVDRTGVEGVGADWSPDGRSIAVETQIRGGGSWTNNVPIDGRIGLLDVASRALTPITPPGFNFHDERTGRWEVGGSSCPAWSPDGRRIAFRHMTKDGPPSIWTVDRDGTNLRRAFEGYRDVRWSADGRSLIAGAEKDRPEDRIEVDRLAVVDPSAFPGPPADLLAAVRDEEGAKARGRAFDAAPIFRRNRAWQNPPLDRPASVSFLHTMAPKRLDERFSWRSDGAMTFAVARRDDARAGREVGKTRVIAPDRRQSTFGPGTPYPKVDAKSEADVVAYARSHLMGTRVNFAALDWGRDPSAFEVLVVRPAADGKTVELEIAPNRRRYWINAGAMFETTSWAYMHDVGVTRSLLTIDAATHRIVREVDFGPKGKICEVTLSDWHDVDPTQSVPLRLQIEFVEYKLVVDDRFAWHPEGLWILKEGTSKFPESEAQREEVVELTIGRPDPALDAALKRARDGLAALDAPAAPDEPRDVAAGRFAPGRRIPLGDGTGPLGAVTFTLRGTRPNEPSDHWDGPTLLARFERAGGPAPAGAQLVVVLYDEKAMPLGATRTSIPAGAGAFEVDLGPCDGLDEARTWSLTLLDGDRAVPIFPRDGAVPARERSAYPARFDEPMVVQAKADEAKMRIRSVGLRRVAAGGIAADVEIVGLDHWTEHGASATVVLLDEANVPIAAGTLDRPVHVEGEVVQDRGTLDLGRVDREPKRMLVGLRAVLTSMPMGSRWGMLMRADRSHPIDLFLEADDSQVWRRGLAALNDRARETFRGIRPHDPDGSQRRLAIGAARRAIKPHRDRLVRLLGTANDPDGLPLLCRVAGYSGDERLAGPMRRLLDHPRADVRESAAIGLGLLGDASVAPRLRAHLDRLPREEDQDSRSAALIRADLTNALGTIGGR